MTNAQKRLTTRLFDIATDAAIFHLGSLLATAKASGAIDMERFDHFASRLTELEMFIHHLRRVYVYPRN